MPQLALLCLILASSTSALLPPTKPIKQTALRAANAEAFVTEQAPDLLKEIVMKKTLLGEGARRANALTGGSAKLEHVTLDKIDGAGLEFTCSVKRRAGGFGGGFSTDDEATTATWGDLLECGWEADQCEADVDGATAQRRLMEVACSLGLNGDAARLLSTEFPGGLGDAGALPNNLWLNNIPASKKARSHLGDAVCDAVVAAILEGAPTLSVTVKPPELDPEMDTYRIGTLLELARHLASRIIEGTGRRVRICVQAPMGEGVLAGLPISLNGVRKLMEMMDWGAQGEELQAKKFIGFGAVGADWVDKDDDVFVVLAPQSIVGSSIVPLLKEMVEAAAGRPVILINGRMGDVQSAAGVMSYRGRADRLDFVDEFRECFHFSLVVPMGRTFFPIIGAVCRPFLDCPYTLYRRQELCSEENRVFANSVERAEAARAGDLVEVYQPVGCYGEMPTAKEQKLAYREAAKADLEAGRVVRA